MIEPPVMISPWAGDDYIITGNLDPLADRHLSHRVAAEYSTGGRFGWQSANLKFFMHLTIPFHFYRNKL